MRISDWSSDVCSSDLFNRGVDNALLKPGAQTYKAVTPTAARRGVRNVLNNADEPLSFINALLQGKVGRAFHTLGRFVVNTTIGVGGLADHASSMGLEEKPEDRSEEHTSELQSLMRISYAVFCLKKKTTHQPYQTKTNK